MALQLLFRPGLIGMVLIAGGVVVDGWKWSLVVTPSGFLYPHALGLALPLA